MRLSDVKDWFLRLARSQRKPERRKLRTRLLLSLIPSSMIVLAATGYATYWTSSEFISIALERISRLHATTTAHAVEDYLAKYKRDLLFAARMPITPEGMARYLSDLKGIGGEIFTEFGYIPKREGQHIAFVTQGNMTIRLTPDEMREIRPSPVLLYGRIDGLKMGEVWLSRFKEVEYPFPTEENPHARFSVKVIRFVTPCQDENGDITGFLYLAIDARNIRNILSLYDSKKSPVFAFPRNPRLSRYTFFFDDEGWVIFQSESVEIPEADLNTLEFRAVKRGTLGRPGLPNAFRPADDEGRYWQIVDDARNGGKGLLRAVDDAYGRSSDRNYFLAYAPVQLVLSLGEAPVVIGGVGYVDRSVLIELAGYRHLDVMIVITVIAVLAITGVIAITARRTTHGLIELASAVAHVRDKGRWEEIRLHETGYEAETLKESINSMIATIRKQFDEIRAKDMEIESVALKEPATLAVDHHPPGVDDVFPEFIGSGPLMSQLKRDIAKAGQVDVDVLIEGETGTGKQLAAEAVHRLSRRADKPFISINCGELDENLLLDTLFGHVKGAFTDGKTDRRGAFLEANGGTLFLDEIQSASLKVQQALLRAISMRKVKPLGSDKETDVDVRLITATNFDLKTLIEQGKFREDLYYRLKVITIQTPPLREHRQNVPSLALHFLREAERMAGRSGLTLSRGALEKLVIYHWPGNIRELKHVIITAAVMVEGKIIQAEQLNLDMETADASLLVPRNGDTPLLPPDGDREPLSTGSSSSSPRDTFPPDLNRRQIAAYEFAVRNGDITSKDLLRLMDGSISKRTATYDIQDLVARGLLEKIGKGPTTRYVLARKQQES
ncbi:putative sensor with HAMP domain containing protein [Alkalidesulfovibrio alkalitolerans DSM 16529]|uniref:Putative sensor with HAMP domain containing protein n=1 Tax=Alkalidesulfovibrio alkalitolerans DSM 16529 TaxID=1121439 RepID=S7T7K9_9BACT|nr:sigma 54-interacting transcriptional regulator [Alkalidesulfovibrio alkalitolerans]EPR33107.1 putative sensor with HAMP domain containing protein [Alkalidesulfovibrio alkalitolerans DSM 16529]